MEDGEKSFRQISREAGITSPTAKARFERPVNVCFIKGVVPVFDYSKAEPGKENPKKGESIDNNVTNNKILTAIDKTERKITVQVTMTFLTSMTE